MSPSNDRHRAMVAITRTVGVAVATAGLALRIGRLGGRFRSHRGAGRRGRTSRSTSPAAA